MARVLEVLIDASEKAASIARSCCEGNNKELLVAEKCEGEANARFDKDFKTIADVLAQEAAKTVIARHFPNLAEHVKGEECSEIGGVAIKMQSTPEKTAELLSSILPMRTAERMALAAHADIDLSHIDFPKNVISDNIADLGVWIDPIDATAEFIAGVRGEAIAGGGLSCVTVLIGAYLRSTGEPVIGVINQPFYNNGKGRIIWGVNDGEHKTWGCSDKGIDINSNVILMSGAENPVIAEKMKKSGWEVKSVPGAGHKLMKVALGEAAAYIVSKGTTFCWDTCAPHAVIRAKGGDVVSFIDKSPIAYNVAENVDMDSQQYCNSGGLIAYSDVNVFKKILDNLI